ncbi:MAG TPA: hypothetical protein VGL62_08145 [Vicinamibacterales bacterium]|jgi:type IV pilus assembly protein PilP
MRLTLTRVNSQLSTANDARSVRLWSPCDRGRWKWVVVSAALAAAWPAAPASAQFPDPAKAINAAKAARAATEAADRKNSEALDPETAQTPTAKPPQPPAGAVQPSEPSGAQPPAPASGGYTYDPAGRRDPFVSLLGRGGDVSVSTASRPAGLAGVLINEVTVKGVFKSSKDNLALLQAPDNKTYIVQAGAKLLDGTVKTVTPNEVVFSQDVNDPLSLVKQREVRKSIRPQGS